MLIEKLTNISKMRGTQVIRSALCHPFNLLFCFLLDLIMGQHLESWQQRREKTMIKKKRKEYIYLTENSLMKAIFKGETCCSITV